MTCRLTQITMPAIVTMLGITLATSAFAAPQMKSGEPVKVSPARPMKIAEQKPETTMMLPARAEDDRATEALNSLEASGFATFSNFRADGRVFSADVTRNDKTTRVRIDPDAHQVTTPSA